MTDFILRYRWIIFISCLVVGILSLTLIPAIQIDPEIRNYVPVSLKSRTETDKIEKEFGMQDMIMVLFIDSCILTSDNLNQIKEIDKSISRINGVDGRVSPFTVRSIRSEEGMMVVDPLIKRIPGDSAGLKELGREILNNRFARDIVISSDLTTASIAATLNKKEAELVILARIDSVIASHPGKAKVLRGGLPYIRQSIMNDVSRDALILVPIALLVMFLVLKVNIGQWRLVMMPFTVVLLSTGFTVALIPLLGWKMSLITLLVPIILIAVANNYGIYLVARFQELRILHANASKRELIQLLIRSLNMPILFSGFTTIAGILGLLTHSIIPAKQVGVLAAAGVSMALLMSLLLIPALIFVTGTGLQVRINRKNSTDTFSKLMKILSAVITKNPGKTLVAFSLVLIIVSSGIVFLKINTNQETNFTRKYPVRQASEIINSKFGGSQTISIMVTGDIKNPAVMRGIDELTRNLEKEKGVGSVFSISQVVREMSKAIFNSTEGSYDEIPSTKEAIAQMFELYNMSGNQEDFKQLMNTDNANAQILIRLSDPGNSTITRVEARIAGLTENFPGTVITGGYAIIMADFARSLIRGQIWSLLFAFVSVLILLSIIFKSFKGGLIGSIPLVASVLVLFGFMGFAGFALDAATALLSSIMIGVGVDFTIQYIWCFNLQVRNGLSYPLATESALRTIGRSIIINALSVMAGFAALIFSGFLSIRFFGYLVIISIGSCLIGAIIVIPAFLLKFKPHFIGFETGNNKYGKDETINDVTSPNSATFTVGSSNA